MQHMRKTRSQFTPDEDRRLALIVQACGTSNWELIAAHMPGRNVRQCRDRWMNFLNDSVCHKKWTVEEDARLLEKYQQYGPKWRVLEQFFNGRKNYAIRNRYHSLLHKMEVIKRRRAEAERQEDAQELQIGDVNEMDWDLDFGDGPMFDEYGTFDSIFV